MADDKGVINIGDLSLALSVVLVETVAALSPAPKEADEHLEAIASRLLTFADQIDHPASSGTKRLLSALAGDLISTEAPGQSKG